MSAAKAELGGGEAPERRPPCFFDPRHGPSVGDVEWAPSGGQPRPVPVCAADLQRISDGVDPEPRRVPVDGQDGPLLAGGELPTCHGPAASSAAASARAVHRLGAGRRHGHVRRGRDGGIRSEERRVAIRRRHPATRGRRDFGDFGGGGRPKRPARLQVSQELPDCRVRLSRPLDLGRVAGRELDVARLRQRAFSTCFMKAIGTSRSLAPQTNSESHWSVSRRVQKPSSPCGSSR